VSKYFLQGINYYAHPELLHISYSYPPIDLLLFVPFTFFPFQAAEVFWTAINIGLLVVSLFYLTKIFSVKFFSRINMLLSSLVFIAFPTKFTLGMGQLNIFVLGLIVYGLWLMKKKNLYKAGFVFGAALSVKFSPIFLLFYFLFNFNRKVMYGFMLAVVVTIILTILFVPYQTYSYYIFKILPNFVLSSWKLEYYNQSLSGAVGRSFGTGAFSGILKTIIALVCIVGSFIVIIRNKQKDRLTFMMKIGILISLSLLFNTFSWQHHFVWMIIPFYASIFYLRSLKSLKSKFRIYLLISAAYILVSINFPNPNILPVILQSHVFYGGLLLLIIDLHLLKKSL